MKIFYRLISRAFYSFKRRKNTFLKKLVINEIGSNFICDTDVKIYNPQNLKIGNNVTLNSGVLIQSCENAKISIGNNVVISYNTLIISGDLDFKLDELDHSHNTDNITISDNVWIGADVKILKGVEIYKNIIVAAGSLVNKSLTESNYIYAGVPAKKIKKIIK